MDLQTRELNLITYLAQLQNENFFEKFENYIFKNSRETNQEFTSFSADKLISRIEKSEEDFRNGKVITQDDLEKVCANW
ncbi:MAG: hypothetical protein Q4F57_01065 [Weeksellaceae bacterium]|nr:hypothetical protein [Weeksellaceae bacterium]